MAFVKTVSDKRLHTQTYFAVAALIMSVLVTISLYGINALVVMSSEIKADFQIFEQFFMASTYGTTHASAAHVVFQVGLWY